MPIRRRTLAVLLFAAMVWVPPVPAQAQVLSPPPRDLWPRGVPLPKIVRGGGPIAELTGAVPSLDRRVVGILTVDHAGVASICSDALLTKDIVLTAAHCTCGITRYSVTNDRNVITKSGKLTNARWCAATLLSAFGGYDCSVGPFGGNDLALLKASGARFTDRDGVSISDDYSIVDTITQSVRWMRAPLARLRVDGYGYDGFSAGSLGGRRTALIEVDSTACLEVDLDWTAAPFFLNLFSE